MLPPFLSGHPRLISGQAALLGEKQAEGSTLQVVPEDQRSTRLRLQEPSRSCPASWVIFSPCGEGRGMCPYQLGSISASSVVL
jgi:hypothetical protein